jgi:putative hydrolase of the HAD superfamily
MSEWESVAWIPGVEKALKILSANFTCVIATSANHSGTEEMISALKRVGADQYFHHFYSSKQLGFQKPDPRFFKAIAEQLKIEPELCMMIGNLYEKDIVGAKSAGMQTILFDQQNQNIDFPDADIVIHQMDELIHLFR